MASRRCDDEDPDTGNGALLKGALEVSPVFLLAGFGMVISGRLLEQVSDHWQVFKDVPALLILIPALLGLKGNLEMTLGARLGSHAANQELQGEQFWAIATSNVMAVQCQAIVVGAVASGLAIVENYATSQVWNSRHALLLATSSITAASVASLVLSMLMIVIVVAAAKRGIDPDNITAPVAGMLGDFCTLGIVCVIARFFWALPSDIFDMLIILLGLYSIVAIFCGLNSYKSKYTHEVMSYGWYPVLASMVLSNLSGPISKYSIAEFNNFANFQVVMNGAGGNLGSILAAKLTTDLSVTKQEFLQPTEDEDLGVNLLNRPSQPILPASCRRLTRRVSNLGLTKHDKAARLKRDSWAHRAVRTSWVNMESSQSYSLDLMTLRLFRGEGDMVRFARLLLFLVLPGQFVFACFVTAIASNWTALPTPLFVLCFVLASFCQVVVLAAFARTFVVVFWRYKIDPDNAASPLVCGMGDLVGTSFMTLAFLAVRRLNGVAWPGGGL